MNPPPRSWSIYSRTEITEHYKIFERIGSGAYADVYRASRLSDGLIVALKEIHDYQSAFREIEALQILQNSPNIVSLYEYFWRDDEDAVLVLEYLRTDLSSVVREAKKNWENGLTAGEIKRWSIQILLGVDACHRNSIVHRDLKPANLLISDDGVLKLADFGQARILLEPRYVGEDTTLHAENTPSQMWTIQQPDVDVVSGMDKSSAEKSDEQDQTNVGKEEYLQQLNDFKVKDSLDEIDKDTTFQDGDASCLATCTTSDLEDDTLKSSYSYEVEGEGEEGLGPLTSCVGSRWFKAPELLYGSTNYGKEIDLWSLGCIFAELLNLEPLFPGVSDIDQISRINNVLGNLSEETWPGCLKLPDYGKICFGKIEKPLGLESCLPNRSSAEVELIRKLVCYDPASRATAMELLQDSYFHEEPLPLPENQLRVPSSNSEQDGFDYKDMSSDSDFDEFQGNGFDVSNTANGFSIRFP